MTVPDGMNLEAMLQLGRDNAVLSRHEEEALARQAADGDMLARSRLLASHVRMAVAEARRLRAPGADQDDLMQQGVLGLVEAVDRFRIEEGVRFATFARHWVRNRVREHVMANCMPVRLGKSRPEKTLYGNLARLRRAHGVKDYEPLTYEQAERIGAELEIHADRVHRLDHYWFTGDVSLDAVRPGAGEAVHTTFRDEAAVDPEMRAMERQEARRKRDRLKQALATLDRREREIVLGRRLRETPLTLQDLGTSLGISRERVRQIENGALKKLRARMGEQETATAA